MGKKRGGAVVPPVVGGAGLLVGETAGFATDFTYATDASRVAVKETLGAELLSNGTLDSDTIWTKGTGWTIAAGVATKGPSAGSANLGQSIATLTAGKTYKIVFTLSNVTVGNFNVVITGGANISTTLRNSSGTYTEYLVATAAHNVFNLVASAGATDGSVDNISIKEVLTAGGTATITSYAVDSFYSNAGTSPKQVWDVNGVLSWVPHNMVIQSEDFTQATWTKTSTPVVTAHTIEDNNAAAAAQISSNNVGHVVGGTYTASIWILKDAVTTRYPLFSVAGVSSCQINVNTSTGATNIITNSIASTHLMEDVTTHWKLKITYIADNANMILRLYPAYNLVLGGAAQITALGTITVDKVQVNRGYVPTEYLPTTAAARFGLAIDYDPVTHAAKGLLCEPAGTNLSFRSSEFDVIWTAANGALVTADNAIAPNGTMTADKISDDTAASSSSTTGMQNNSMTVAATSVYTFSVFVKAGTYSSIDIRTVNDDLVRSGIFDLSTQIFTPGGGSPTGVFQALPNGWYRIAMTWTTGADTAISVRVGFGGTITRDGTHNFYVWGAQMELGTVPTSHIPTFAASVTRAVDIYNITSAQINYSGTAGSWWVDVEHRIVSTARIVSCTTGGPPPANPLYIVNANNMGILDGTSLNRGISPTNGRHKVASAYTTGDRAITWDGMAVATDAGVVTNLLAPGATFYIGCRVSGVDSLSGYIYKIRYVPRRKTNPELVTETT
jgi:hypothetical protein